MPRRTHPTYLIGLLVCVVLILSAGSLIRQPQAVTFGTKLFLSTVISDVEQPSSTVLPLEPTPTPLPQPFPLGSFVAGVDVSGRTPDEAHALVAEALASWKESLPLVADMSALAPDAPLLDLPALGALPDVSQLIADAEAQAARGEPVNVRWRPTVDPARLRAALAAAAPQFEQIAAAPPTITDDDPPQITFHPQTRQTLDVEATAALLEAWLADPGQPITRTVVLRTERSAGTLADLERALRQQLQSWDGVAGIAVHDLDSGEWMGINDNTVFSGASVMKVPIMVYAYAKLGQLNDQQRAWVEATILYSNNSTANYLLAAGAGGRGLEAAAQGALETTAMLRALGLEHTSILVPYESTDWLAQHGMLPERRPEREGSEPYTDAGGFIRATPRELAEFFTMLVQCSQGTGPLLDYWQGALTPEACAEMIDWLVRPHDTQRMMAGIPDEVKVGHKGGWLLDMQADVGIVYSPNRTYVAAIYLWRDGLVSDGNASPSPYLGALSHTIYSFYNPE